MKKRIIELSEEDYQFLTKLAIAMKTQDNQNTSFPLYCIYDKQDNNPARFMAGFFSEKAMHKHLNDYVDDFTSPYTYVKSAAYNEEIKRLMEIIISLDDLVLPEHDNQAYE